MCTNAYENASSARIRPTESDSQEPGHSTATLWTMKVLGKHPIQKATQSVNLEHIAKNRRKEDPWTVHYKPGDGFRGAQAWPSLWFPAHHLHLDSGCISSSLDSLSDGKELTAPSQFKLTRSSYCNAQLRTARIRSQMHEHPWSRHSTSRRKTLPAPIQSRTLVKLHRQLNMLKQSVHSVSSIRSTLSANYQNQLSISTKLLHHRQLYTTTS